ncbi:hypothetical protein CFOL_v3_22735 [Cephalotus follicularis]|uniref:Uncharacterized protein n=1 Tax=Cephalotus follicularis TaxID=3775 RepID=A0A1Q3CG96_CEPFO|nr:hypothetical protein CFOL_v3_22735 [Cephalotus follicularis]
MQEELNQFDKSNVWSLVPRPKNQSTIRTKWMKMGWLVLKVLNCIKWMSKVHF